MGSDEVDGDAVRLVTLEAGEGRLDKALAARLPDLSRARIQALLADGRISLDGFKLGRAEASIALFGKNLFNEKTPSYALSLSTIIGYQYERSRTYGVDINVNF